MKTSKKPIQKIKHQIKSNMYYIFWGAATIAVMAGQIYVGNGYRTMSESIRDLTEMIEIKFEYDLLKDSRRKMPVIQ
jgi:N-dimethylarginine dimethylaminohydrolase